MKQYPEGLGAGKHLVHVGIGNDTEQWRYGLVYLCVFSCGPFAEYTCKGGNLYRLIL